MGTKSARDCRQEGRGIDRDTKYSYVVADGMCKIWSHTIQA
jgi:hypothetical protein